MQLRECNPPSSGRTIPTRDDTRAHVEFFVWRRRPRRVPAGLPEGYLELSSMGSLPPSEYDFPTCATVCEGLELALEDQLGHVGTDAAA